MPQKLPFKRKGSKAIIETPQIGRGKDSYTIQKCDKTGNYLRIGGAIYNEHGQPVHFSKRPRPGEPEYYAHRDELEKVGVIKLKRLRICAGRVAQWANSRHASHRQLAKESRAEALQLFQELKTEKQYGPVRFLLRNINITQKMTPEQFARVEKILTRRIVE